MTVGTAPTSSIVIHRLRKVRHYDVAACGHNSNPKGAMKTYQNLLRKSVAATAPFHKKFVATAIAVLAGVLTAHAGQGPQPSICNRACWAARAPTCGISQMSALNRAIIHHTAGAGDYSADINTSKSKIRAVQNLHINNGWCDIAYHFLVDAGGNIFEGRSGSWSGLPRGTHDSYNQNSFGFNVLGYYHPPYNHSFTSASRNSLEAVIAWRMPSAWSPYGSGTYNGRTVGYLDGHYMVKATACPGDGIIPSIPGIRDGVNARKNGTQPPSWSPTVKPSLVWLPDGRMTLFAIGNDNAVWHAWQTAPGGAWSSWSSLGTGPFVKCQGMVEPDGRLVVYAHVAGGGLWQKWQTAPGGSWSAWSSLGGGLKDFEVIRMSNGLPVAFGIGTDDGVWHAWQTIPNGAWSSWQTLGTGPFAKCQPMLESDGRLSVYAHVNGAGLWQKWQTSVGGAWSSWSNLGGGITDFEVIRMPNGLPVAFGVGSDTVMYHTWQTAPGGAWSTWTSLGGGYFSKVDALKKPDGQLVVFALNLGGEVYHSWQTAPGGTWASWTSLGTTLTSLTADTASNGAMLFFGRGMDSAMWHRWQTAPGGAWSSWSNMGGGFK
jgi:hypothetical protein